MGVGYAIFEGRGPLSLGVKGRIPATGPTLDLSNRGKMCACGAESAGPGTNNQAEYHAMIAGLRRALYLGVRRLVVVGDSQLTVRQVSGSWKCKGKKLIPLCELATGLSRCFAVCECTFVKREDNALCDELASRKPAIPERFMNPPDGPLDKPVKRALTDKQAALLRWLWMARGFDCGELGRIFGLSSIHAWKIATNERYNHITEEHL